MEEKKRGSRSAFWRWVIASILFRLILVYFPKNLHLSSRPEVSTPLTMAEGYWLKQSSISPYAGSMHHGSPLLLSILGPLTVFTLLQVDLSINLFFVLVDIINALLIRATGWCIQEVYGRTLKSLDLVKPSEASEIILSGDLAALVYLWNPFTIVACIGLSTSPVENMAIIVSLYGACTGLVPLAAFGWGLLVSIEIRKMYNVIWLCRTYGFILTVEDLSPNIGVLWYFFAEVFDFFRSFFLIVFHMNIFFMVLPLAIRLKHLPAFLAFVYVAIVAIFKSYPSVGDSALYLGLLALFANELADMKFSFFLFCGYIGVSLLSPVMHNLWIWRGTGNANFYFATAMAYACFQEVAESQEVSRKRDFMERRVKQSIILL
ncbi:hypothetical protein SAY87_019705 [Trapa incisa]|uniref:Phosphatidylinositol glycan anchor biosynthesis class U protein n=1 Tax=Trapa incisa TaxID=236973 RepID=A0AAN7Q3C3_9MYRT|nr:hypothetical protein SAY87_019705 [Trapa incisa]